MSESEPENLQCHSDIVFVIYHDTTNRTTRGREDNRRENRSATMTIDTNTTIILYTTCLSSIILYTIDYTIVRTRKHPIHTTTPLYGSMNHGREVVPLEEGGNAVHHSSSSSNNSTSGMTWFWRGLHFCNTAASTILVGVVIFLFLQLQYVSYQLNQQADDLKDLQTQITNQTQGQIQELTDKVDKEHSQSLYQLAGFFTLLTCLLTCFHISMHLRNFHEPVVQRRILTILWFSPIYGITSFLSLMFPSADGYLAVVKDFYEAYVVYTFLSFLIAVLGKGDRDAVVNILSQHADHLQLPTKLLWRFYHPPPDSSDRAKANAVLLECQILCMQFVLVRPVTSIASFVSSILMQDVEEDDSNWAYFKSPNFYIAMVTNISIFLAFRGLLKIYHAVREELLWCQPFSKFMAIKGIIFLTFWQGLAISIFVNLNQGADGDNDDVLDDNGDDQTAQEKAAEIQNVLICMEMLFFSIAHWCVFPAEEWEPDYRPKQYAKPGIGLKDFVSDMSFIMSSSSDARAYRREASSNQTSTEDDGEGDEENGVDSLRLQEEDDDNKII